MAPAYCEQCPPPGASRGFGRAIAVELGKVVGAGSTLLLLARNKELLEVTRDMCRDVRPGLAVEVQSLDLSTADKEAFEKVVRAHQGSADHEVAMVVHNAGTLGQDGRRVTVRLRHWHWHWHWHRHGHFNVTNPHGRT